jgi:flagellar FliL protein
MAKDKNPSVDEDGEDKQEAPPKKSGSAKKLILINVGALALVATSVGATFFVTSMMQKPEPVAKKKTKTAAKKPVADESEDKAEKEEPEDKAEGEAKEGEAKEAEAKDGEDDDAAEKEAKSKTAVYLDFEQPFIVNFQDEQQQLRYLQVGVSVMAHDPTMAETVKRHMPVIRNNLVMLFSSQTRDSASTREGKERIRNDAQTEVQKILTDRTGKPVVEALYFTSFVMQ